MLTGVSQATTPRRCALLRHRRGGGSGDAPDVTIADSVLTGNEAGGGGALWVDYSALTITGSTLSNNEATEFYGGGLYTRGEASRTAR